VAAEKIETILSRCPLIAQVFVYGDSLQAYLVCIRAVWSTVGPHHPVATSCRRN